MDVWPNCVAIYSLRSLEWRLFVSVVIAVVIISSVQMQHNSAFF